MVTEALFTPLPPVAGTPPRAMVSIDFNGVPLALPAGITLAAGLLAAGVRRFRSAPVGGDARAPYCMMGVCFECLLEIDGVPSQQACLVQPREGMRVRTMDALPGLAFPVPASQPDAESAVCGGRHD
ncbi:(2Fe-2S)-binding protein [Corticibacter populi]|uniref:(2Fe-2S)-binding protein n=1 Tax=Corticibacter populi TaxID=1550736 RepID=A0A3M6QLX0_9BURK|nr:(2Fe-2S)-binding protein [Corticibacter populi]RMX03509.1 (2Fe-2S)-binding protein [Corticibacter populi]RZS29954.1 2Fe-2S iron-sulfur cluster protein [Corticibacter populi]